MNCGNKGFVLRRVLSVPCLVAAFIAAYLASNTHAAPPAFAVMLGNEGTLTTTTYTLLAISSNTVVAPYSWTSLIPAPVRPGDPTSLKMTFQPGSGVFASANNLAGSTTSILSTTLRFDLMLSANFGPMTASIVEDGIFSAAGNGRASAAATDLAGGMIISQFDDPLAPETHGVSFAGDAAYIPGTDGTWSLTSQLQPFSKSYHKYHVVIDNDLIAEALALPDSPPSFAAIAKKDLSVIFTFADASGGSAILTPEPATVGILLVTSALLLAKRARRCAV